MDIVKKKPLSPKQVALALEAAKGNVAVAARTLGRRRSTVYNYLNNYPQLKKVLHDSRESMLDNAESALHSAALKGEGWAVCFMLKTIGRQRGYVEKVEVEHHVIQTEITSELARLGLAEAEDLSRTAESYPDARIN